MADRSWHFETAAELAELAGAAADRIERERRIVPDVVDEIMERGFFRLLLPKSLGGAELDHPSFLKIVGIFAEADGSVAWCINQNNVFSTNAVRVPVETVREIWGDAESVLTTGTVITNGPPTADTKAVVSDGGYLLSGRWNFSSGIRHANWAAGLAPVYATGADRPFEMRTFLLPIEDVEVIDNWDVGGLRGTGSFGFAVRDAFVPSARSYDASDPSREPGALYVIDTTPLFASGFATVALGVARAGLDAAIELSSRKTQQGQDSVLHAEVPTQRMVGEAEAVWNSARAFLDEATAEMWDAATVRGELSVSDRIGVRLASTHAIRQSAKVVDMAYSICGSSAIFGSNPIQRRFQDVHAITQQIQGRLTHYDTAGQHYLGLEPKGIF